MKSVVILTHWFFMSIGLALLYPACAIAAHPDGELRIEVVDSDTGQPIAARMHLYAASSAVRRTAAVQTAKRPTKVNLPGTAEFGGHFYIDGTIALPLRIGSYLFELEAGPEYLSQS